jgi:hypothetical protein
MRVIKLKGPKRHSLQVREVASAVVAAHLFADVGFLLQIQIIRYLGGAHLLRSPTAVPNQRL